MKTLTASAVSLLLGLVIGWYFEHRHSERETTEMGQVMVQGTETSVALGATTAARAIQLIESGEAQQAVQLLSSPVARDYSLSADTVRTDERSTKLRALIDQLARTNQLVAARIAEVSNAARIKTP
jgi:hypothetical protein